MCFAPQRHALFRHLNLQKWSKPLVFCTFWLGNVLRATTACTFSTSQLPKVVQTPSVFNILTWKCASRHNGVHFFDIWTSKSGAELVCFVHFDFKMCFAPQRRALFRHLNCQKWSAPGVLCTFWLGNVLCATTACNFSSLIWPAGSAPAALASLLFDPPEPQIIGKTQCFATFLPFRASTSSFFLLFFLLIFLFSLPLPCSAFHLSILSEVWLLNFLRWYNQAQCQDASNTSGSWADQHLSNFFWGFKGHPLSKNHIIYVVPHVTTPWHVAWWFCAVQDWGSNSLMPPYEIGRMMFPAVNSQNTSLYFGILSEWTSWPRVAHMSRLKHKWSTRCPCVPSKAARHHVEGSTQEVAQNRGFSPSSIPMTEVSGKPRSTSGFQHVSACFSISHQVS